MANKRVTLADVAAAAGVAPATASLVLADRGFELRISEAAQIKVRQAASLLGYRPNAVSQGLRTGTTSTIGFISDNIATSQLAGNTIKGALEAARSQGFMLFIAETDGDAATELATIHAMMDRQVDGIILATMFTRYHEPPAIVDEGIPTILLNNLPNSRRPLDAVVPDEITAGWTAADYMIEAGHQKIHLLGAGPLPSDVPPDSIAAVQRLQGIQERLSAEGLVPLSYHPMPDWIPVNGRAAMEAVLAQDPFPEAIICFNDRVALGAYQVLQEHGLRIPDDVSVVSFDDFDIAGWMRPGLTTIAIPHRAMGRMAVELLLARIRDIGGSDQSPGAVHRVPMPLHVRESVRGQNDDI
ncbi:MAG: LacI family DNA-binding transcriptional regulator [Propionibacteriaceae bacterium]|jgi:LacI family transcriptional regulator|nr:LacI family DNA-binding transcriptional regulator [Propionibacteriaceae bacterium]